MHFNANSYASCFCGPARVKATLTHDLLAIMQTVMLPVFLRDLWLTAPWVLRDAGKTASGTELLQTLMLTVSCHGCERVHSLETCQCKLLAKLERISCLKCEPHRLNRFLSPSDTQGIRGVSHHKALRQKKSFLCLILGRVIKRYVFLQPYVPV